MSACLRCGGSGHEPNDGDRNESPDDILTSAEVAALLGVRPATLKARRLRRDGSAPPHLKGGRPKYRRRDVMEFIERQIRSRR